MLNKKKQMRITKLSKRIYYFENEHTKLDTDSKPTLAQCKETQPSNTISTKNSPTAFSKHRQITSGTREKSRKLETHNTVMSEKEGQIIEWKNSNGVCRFEKGCFLGKGGFARCHKITNLDSMKLSAIKIINKELLKSNKAKQKIITQIKIHRTLSHKHVVPFEQVFQDCHSIYIVLGLCQNHTLHELIKRRKRLSEIEVQYFLRQIIEGLTYIHKNRVIHRDLKLGNLMLDEKMEVKIGDFGLAARLDYGGQRRKTICGTPNYLAPEIIEGKGHSYEVDIWSLGVVVYALLYGRPPFQTTDAKKTYKLIKECKYSFSEQVSVSNNAQNLISKILVFNPSQRLTLDQILQHPFMTSGKIPAQLPVSILKGPLPHNFTKQFLRLSESPKMKDIKSLEKVESQCQKYKIKKGASERILRVTIGNNKNYFSRNLKKEDCISKATLTMTNNFFENAANRANLMQYVARPNTQNRIRPDTQSRLRPDTQAKSHRDGELYIRKWVDYTSKYGLGYLLSNGCTGIYFNDGTKMCVDSVGERIDYIDMKCNLLTFTSKQQTQNREIAKKVMLMQYFRRYLTGKENNTQTGQNSRIFIYVKKWAKSDKAILFRLNNKVVQINFNDKTQLLINTQTQTLAYSAPHHTDREYYQLDCPNSQKPQELIKRMEHAKNLILKVIEQKQNEPLALNVQPVA